MNPRTWWLTAAAVPVLFVGAVVGFLLVLQPPPAAGCGDGGEAAGEPTGPAVGNLGGVSGTGLSEAEVNTVRASPLAGPNFTEGVFLGTSYGPPWGGIQGAGIATAGGLLLNGGAPRKYFIATDPSIISTGKWVYAWPNPFGWRGPFLAADTGGAIRGKHLDFYDWRGRAFQRTYPTVKVTAGPRLQDDDPLRPADLFGTTGQDAATDLCGDSMAGVGPIDFDHAKLITTPGHMTELPAWATARGYAGPAILDGHARVDSRIAGNLLSILQKYDLRVHDCLASGHNTHGNGDSCDIVPADDPLPVPGRMTPGWANVTRLARDLGWVPPGPGYPGGYACNSGMPFKPAIYIVCYDGDADHGDPAHITGSCACPHVHLSWKAAVQGAPVALASPPAWVWVFTSSSATDADGQTDEHDGPGRRQVTRS